MSKLTIKRGKNKCRICGEKLKKGKATDHESCTTALLTGAIETTTNHKFLTTINPNFNIIIKWIRYDNHAKQDLYDLTFLFLGQELKIEGGHEKSLVKLANEMGKSIKKVIKQIKKR